MAENDRTRDKVTFIFDDPQVKKAGAKLSTQCAQGHHGSGAEVTQQPVYEDSNETSRRQLLSGHPLPGNRCETIGGETTSKQILEMINDIKSTGH